MKTILIAVDFSDVTAKLLDAATAMADAESKVYIIHVAAPEPDFIGLGVGPEYIRQDRAQALREEHRWLGSYKATLEKRGLNAEALLISGSTVELLLEEVKKLKADLLIIGKKGHSKLFEVIIGSVAKEIIHKIKIPTLLIPE
jgi:nucleotide-binding universal stress UspA family protein